MARIIFFPATGSRSKHASIVTRSPVLTTDEQRVLAERPAVEQNQFRLSLDPWDLQRIVAEANRLGREGVSVVGFGYDYDNNAIVLGPRRAG